MIQRPNFRPAWVVLLLIVAFILMVSLGNKPFGREQQKQENLREKISSVSFEKFKNAAENETCFKCHGQSKYQYENAESKKIITKRMYSETIINREDFYLSNHREFKCIDCHSEDYSIFPHSGSLRMEAKANCIDCHGGDEKYAQYEFEKIDTAFMESVHSQKHSEDFTCWMCHNPHTYKINARTTENLKETIVYDNNICLSCHADIRKYQLLTDKTNPNLLNKHEWLPNQAAHFTNVRCIECHARNEDTLIVAHHVVPKNLAVRKCESCHAKNSILYASLYKYRITEKIQEAGIIKGLIFTDASSIGPDRDNTYNIVSFIIFGLTLFVIFVHALLRIKYIKK